MATTAWSKETISRESAEIQPVVDRQALRDNLEATRTAYHRMMASISEKQWLQRTVNTEWTWRELMQHLVWAVEQLPDEVASAQRGKGMFNYPGWIANPASYWITRWDSRHVTRASLLLRYDAAIDAVLRRLEDVPESDWGKSAPFYGHGIYTVADLFRTPADHFAEHTAGFVPD